MSDFMEIGDTGLIPTSYGFLDTNTGQKLDHEGNPLDKADNETTKEN